MNFPIPLSSRECKGGLIYLAFSLVVLPNLLALLPLRDGLMNFVYYCVNFAAVTLIFRRFLLENVKLSLERAFPTVYYGMLAYLGHRAMGELFALAALSLFPEFYNVNDQSILTMMQRDFLPMAIGTVLLAPVAEECFFRGLIFRGMYDCSPVAAYLVSMVAFSAVHVAGYLGSFAPMQLLLCFLQYLPAGYCLCFAYRRSGSILSPMLVHAAINAVSIASLVR